MYYVDEHIKNTNRVFPQQGRYDYLRYDMNENPEGLPKEFVDSVLKEITPEFLSIYPEPDRFLNKYAAYIGASYENVVAVNGSDMGIRYLLETFGEKGKDVVTVAPSFEMYWVNCSILGLHHVPVAYESDMTISIDKILDAITENTRIVVLLNPNNPIGNVYTEDELEKVIEKTKKVGAIVIIDEADSAVHDYLFKKVFDEIEPFIDGQVIMTTHNTMLMEADFARNATYILSEEEPGNMIVKAISDYDKRTYVNNNVRNKYLNNEYGGLPQVRPIDFACLIRELAET